MWENGLSETVGRIAERLNETGRPWLLGGSCGLALQQVETAAPPRDIDLYADAPDVPALHRQLSRLADSATEPEWSETPIYRSLLGRYRFGRVQAELVGGFRVRTADAVYMTETAALSEHAVRVRLGGAEIRLMPLAHELVFNWLRSRPDRYEAIAARMRADLAGHLPLMRELAARHRFSEEMVNGLGRLLNRSL